MKNVIARYRRFKGWDYAKGASLFITIATKPRRAIFGKEVEGRVILSKLGRDVAEALDAIPKLNHGISLFGRVVMPDHVHFNCRVRAGLPEPLKKLGFAIRRFKNYTTKIAKQRLFVNHNPDVRTAFGPPQTIWQQGYHDYILVSRKMIDSTERYIAYNPLKWKLMHGNGYGLCIKEPLCSPRFDAGDYWKGVGNTALLDEEERIVSLRVSRRVSSPAEIARLIARMESAVKAGYVIISGFISPGERAVRDMLCTNKDARFIRMLPASMPNSRFKPESAYVAPFSEGRYLEIAEGNDEVKLDRGACLDLNEEIVNIATACKGGIALHWLPGGPKILAKHSLAGRPLHATTQ